MDLIVQCGHNTSSENKQKAWPKVGVLNLVHEDPIAGRDQHSHFQSQAITHCFQNLPVTSWTSATTLKAPVLKQHEFLSNYTPIVYWTARDRQHLQSSEESFRKHPVGDCMEGSRGGKPLQHTQEIRQSEKWESNNWLQITVFFQHC